MDLLTLRVAFGLIAACVLVLFWSSTYRVTRSTYAGWWCLALAGFLGSALLYLFNGTTLQVVANPLANALAVFGAGGVWAAARSLRGRAVVHWQWWPAAVAVLVVSLLDDPAHDVWTGGAAYLLGMSLLTGRSAVELWHHLRDDVPGTAASAELRYAVASMAAVSATVGGYFLLRAVAFVAVGPDHPFFVTAFGGVVTTLLNMLLLVVTTFNMSTLSHEHQTTDLQQRATRDGLTGLLNRAAFLEVAQRAADRATHPTSALVIADLDRFKNLNDGHGHAAGDRALVAFGAACLRVLAQPDVRGVAARLGGDEFALLLTEGRAEEVVARIRERYAATGTAQVPTVSFGIAALEPRADVALTLARADEALYEAKAAGRSRAVRHRGSSEPRTA